MNLKLAITILMLCFCWQVSTSQTKNEREERVTVSEFPEMTQTIIEALPNDCKRLKFYKETDGDKQSFEAKFKYKNRHYSLEFSKEGEIEDIEVITKLKHIEQALKTQFVNYFKASFDTYNIIKIQKQFLYSNYKTALNFIEGVLSNETDLAPNFEIIAEVKTEKKRDIREFTFNSKGKILNFRILNPTSYEHVLY